MYQFQPRIRQLDWREIRSIDLDAVCHGDTSSIDSAFNGLVFSDVSLTELASTSAHDLLQLIRALQLTTELTVLRLDRQAKETEIANERFTKLRANAQSKIAELKSQLQRQSTVPTSPPTSAEPAAVFVRFDRLFKLYFLTR